MARPRTVLVVLIVAAATWAATAALVAAFRMESGLRVEYFAGTEWEGDVVRSDVVPNASTATLDADWPNGVPGTFSALWTGYLAVRQAGSYQFSTRSDDGTRLFVDGRQVVDNGGRHSMQTLSGTIHLDAGSHQVVLQYFQGGGLYGVEWQWARDGARPAPVPDWLLSPRRTSYGTAVAGRIVRLVRRISAPVTLLLAAGLIVWWERRASWRHLEGAPRLACLVLFVVLAVVETWPLASDPAPPLAQRQRRHDPERVDHRLDGAPGAPRSAAPLRRQHLLSRARHDRVLREP